MKLAKVLAVTRRRWVVVTLLTLLLLAGCQTKQPPTLTQSPPQTASPAATAPAAPTNPAATAPAAPTNPAATAPAAPTNPAATAPAPPPSPAPTGTVSVHLTLGNPSNATVSATSPDNYLMVKPQYVLSYNRSKSIPNWVSWQLNQSWLSDDRSRCKDPGGQDNFQPDSTLPQGFKPVLPTDYQGSGFDRGHMAPSADRSANRTDNCATFLMTNIIPQSPDVNQGPWAKLESYSRDLAEQGKELYIISGGAGTGGEGRNGFKQNFEGKSSKNPITVPASSWKIIVVLEKPGLGLEGITNNTRVIAVVMPHQQGVKEQRWDAKEGDKFKYITSVDEVEKLTGYDFLTNVPQQTQDIIEAKVDSGA